MAKTSSFPIIDALSLQVAKGIAQLVSKYVLLPGTGTSTVVQY